MGDTSGEGGSASSPHVPRSSFAPLQTPPSLPPLSTSGLAATTPFKKLSLDSDGDQQSEEQDQGLVRTAEPACLVSNPAVLAGFLWRVGITTWEL